MMNDPHDQTHLLINTIENPEAVVMPPAKAQCIINLPGIRCST